MMATVEQVVLVELVVFTMLAVMVEMVETQDQMVGMVAMGVPLVLQQVVLPVEVAMVVMVG
jgi:hypothetical protein